MYLSAYTGAEIDQAIAVVFTLAQTTYTQGSTATVDAHVRGLISGTGNISYVAGTGVISFTGTLLVANGGTGVTSFGGTNRLLYTTATDTLSSITTANTSALVTSSTGVPSWASGGTANRLLRTDGTTVSFAQAALATDVSGTLAATNGGTGTATVTTGDIIYGSATNTWSKLAGVATGNALISGGVATAPSWGKIGLTTHVSGTLAVGNGGTGATSFTAGRVLFGDTANPIATSANLTFNTGTNTLATATVSATLVEAGTLDGLVLDVGDATPNRYLTSSGAGGLSHRYTGPGNFGPITTFDFLSADSSVVDPIGYIRVEDDSGFPIWFFGKYVTGTPNDMVTIYGFDGKITAAGGVDPPYVLYDAHTRSEISERVKRQVPEEKQTGAALFWNKTEKRLEVFVASENKFYDLQRNELSL